MSLDPSDTHPTDLPSRDSQPDGPIGRMRGALILFALIACTIAVGRDNRPSGPALHAALVADKIGLVGVSSADIRTANYAGGLANGGPQRPATDQR